MIKATWWKTLSVGILMIGLLITLVYGNQMTLEVRRILVGIFVIVGTIGIAITLNDFGIKESLMLVFSRVKVMKPKESVALENVQGYFDLDYLHEKSQQNGSKRSDRLLEKHTRNELIDITIHVNQQADIVYASREALTLFGLSLKEIMGKNIFMMQASIGIDNHEWFNEVIEDYSAQVTSESMVLGKKRYILWSYEAYLNDQGKLDMIMINGHEITRFIEMNTMLAHDKDHDTVTKLLNQQGLLARMKSLKKVEKALAFYIDIRNFSEINDYYGHEMGDTLLMSLARELGALEDEMTFVSRLSGDKFLVFTYNEEADLTHLVTTLKKKLVTKHTLGSIELDVYKRIGYARYPEDTQDFLQLIGLSSLAMKASKKDTLDIVKYEKKLSEALSQNVMIAAKLKEALKRESIDIHFQKITDLDKNKVSYIETLARWHDSTMGDLEPKTFIKIAQESNMMEALDRYLIDKALALYKDYKKTNTTTKLCLNIAPSSLLNSHMLDFIKERTDAYGIMPYEVCIEVSESTFVHNLDLCNKRIQAFKAHGFMIALDDFGKEYSSLAILETVDFDIIKIDAMFVQRIEEVNNQEIIRMIQRIAALSNKSIIAEGVETKAQSQQLRMLSCHQQQGFLLHFPEPFKTLKDA